MRALMKIGNAEERLMNELRRVGSINLNQA